MGNIESHLDNVFKQGAENLSKRIVGKICEYRLDAFGYTVKEKDNGKTGTCQILGVWYSVKLDCNMYHLQDLETGKEFNVCQFEVWLKDIGI